MFATTRNPRPSSTTKLSTLGSAPCNLGLAFAQHRHPLVTIRSSPVPSLDGRAPFVVDIHDLGRRAGAMIKVARHEPAPAGLTNPMIGVPEGSPIELELMLESVIDGVLVTGVATAGTHGSCGRCLQEMTAGVSAEIEELYRYADQVDELDDDDEQPILEGELLNLEATVRDSLVLALPLSPHCREDCPGLCPQCGVRLEDQPGHQHDKTDSRWAALAGMFTPDRSADPN